MRRFAANDFELSPIHAGFSNIIASIKSVKLLSVLSHRFHQLFDELFVLVVRMFMFKGFGDIPPHAKKNRQSKEGYLSDTHNVFEIIEKDGDEWKVRNLELHNRGFSEMPPTLDDAINHQVLLNIGVTKPFAECWVSISDEVEVGQLVLGKLSHHPSQVALGFPILKV
jgi:hypothetical protein